MIRENGYVFYHEYWHEIPESRWPKEGEIFVCRDCEKRLGPNTWAVSIMSYKLEKDITCLGLFWKQKHAKLFVKTFANRDDLILFANIKEGD